MGNKVAEGVWGGNITPRRKRESLWLLLPSWSPWSLVASHRNRVAGFAVTFSSAIVRCYTPAGMWFGASFLMRLGICNMALDSNVCVAAQSSPWAALPGFFKWSFKANLGVMLAHCSLRYRCALVVGNTKDNLLLFSCSQGSVCPWGTSSLPNCAVQAEITPGKEQPKGFCYPSSSVFPRCPASSV